MPVNTSLAQMANVLLFSTTILYAVAMLCYAFDLAFAKRRVLATEPVPEMVGAAEPVAVGVGASGSPGAVSSGGADLAGINRPGGTGSVAGLPPAAAPAAAERWPGGFWLRLAFGLTCFGLVLHVLAILTRGLAEHRVPWGNMYEFVGAITCMAVIVLVAASIKYHAYFMGLFVLLPVVLALGIDLTVIYTPAGALVPALQSYWIAIHVTAMIVACGLFIFGAVVTVLYLLSERSERRSAAGQPTWSGGILRFLPRPAVLDRLSYRSVLFGFPVWTFGVIAGAIWADHAWGRYWGWDPKETWSFITWVVYAMFLHARATAGWRGRRAGYIHLIGFGCLMFNLIGVNLWITGLHSYAGL